MRIGFVAGLRMTDALDRMIRANHVLAIEDSGIGPRWNGAAAFRVVKPSDVGVDRLGGIALLWGADTKQTADLIDATPDPIVVVAILGEAKARSPVQLAIERIANTRTRVVVATTIIPGFAIEYEIDHVPGGGIVARDPRTGNALPIVNFYKRK